MFLHKTKYPLSDSRRITFLFFFRKNVFRCSGNLTHSSIRQLPLATTAVYWQSVFFLKAEQDEITTTVVGTDAAQICANSFMVLAYFSDSLCHCRAF